MKPLTIWPSYKTFIGNTLNYELLIAHFELNLRATRHPYLSYPPFFTLYYFVMETNTIPSVEVITHEAIQILKTALMLEKSYAGGYLIRILQADERYQLRKPAHKNLETYGILEGVPFYRLEDIIYYLTQQGYLHVQNRMYGTLEVTDRGRAYLSEPTELEVPRPELYRGWAGIQATMALRTLRRELAEQSGQPPYELFTNYVMDIMARRLPLTVEELDQIDGARNLSDAIKQRILAETTRIQALIERNEATGGLLSRAYSPTHRKVKELFEAKFSVEEIAKRRGIEPTKVRRALADLHEAGQIDLKSWIEKEVDSQTLHKGAEYFRSTQSPHIDEARQVLGFPHDVLHLCRAYSVQVQEPQAAYAL
jgi:ATP-dependent DNA helicase RecQ